MIRYLARSVPGIMRRGRSLYLLTITGVALGVATVLSIQIINRSALAAFRGSVQAVSGDIDLSVLGRTPVFAESLYVSVLGTEGVAGAWPIYRIDVAVRGEDELFLEVLGVDLFQPVGLPLDSTAREVADPLVVRGWVAITPQFGAERGWAPGDTIVVSSGSRVVPLVVGALVDFQRLTPLASRKLAVMDIAQAQALFGSAGLISQIDVKVDPSADRREIAARLTDRLGATVGVLTPEQREQRVAGLLGAFRLNLTAMSLISLFVGLFLVFAAIQAALVRRRREFGVLRSLGGTRLQVLGIILSEVVALGAIGVTIGVPLGYWLAAANVDVVSATITNLYLLNEIERVQLTPLLVVLAAAIGIGGAVAGAIGPALDTARRDPKALLSPFTLHEKLRTATVPLAITGVGLLAAGGVWYGLGGHRWRPAGFVLAVCMLVGFPLVTPLAIRLFTRPIRATDYGFRYSIRSLAVRLQSTSIAVAALAVAVSMLTGITIMVGSFRRTVDVWIQQTVRADVYITTESWTRSAGIAPLDSTLIEAFAAAPEVIAVDRLRGFLGTSEGRRVALAGVDFQSRLPATRFRMLDGDRDQATAQLVEHGAVLISEPLARRTDRWAGDSIPLVSVSGVVHLPIAGVYYDYSSESGAALMDLGTFERVFGPGPISNVALYLERGTDVERFADRLRAQYRDAPLLIRSNPSLREEVFRIFDQTFAITRILQGMSLLIAACGITLTLLVIARERIAELALYRALGAARRQIFMIFVGKGTAMGTLGLALGSVGGVLLAMVLIFVINRAYFGWTIQVFWPWAALAQQAMTILGVAAAAGLYPALRASKTPTTELSREDL